MNKQSETANAIDSQPPSAAPNQIVKNELSEQELEKAAGGHHHHGQDGKPQGKSGADEGPVTSGPAVWNVSKNEKI